MTKEFFEEIMRIPSCSGHEDMMQEYLLGWARKHGCRAKKDGKGNILMVKGKPPTGQFYPGFVNHCDTVHHDQEEMVRQKVFKEIIWDGDEVTAINPLLPKETKFSNRGDRMSRYAGFFGGKDDDDVTDVIQNGDGTFSAADDKEPDEKLDKKSDKNADSKQDEKPGKKPVEMGRQTGLGMDDQGGCALALAVLDAIPFGKAMFCVEEEIGMQGSKAADMSFFDDCAFVISNDSPARNRASHSCSGTVLYSDEFFKKYLKPICTRHGVTQFNEEPYTDIIQVRQHKLPDGKHIECFNFGNGGPTAGAHRDNEWAVWSDVLAAEETLLALCTEIPLDKQHSSELNRPSYSFYGGYGGGSYGDWWKKRYGGGQRQQEFDFGTDEESGFFSWRFEKGEKVCERFVDRVGALLAPEVKITKLSANSVRVEGAVRRLKTAFRFAFNYDNGESYMSWEDFVQNVPSAQKMFDDNVKIQNKKPSGKLSKMEHGDDDDCAITLHFKNADQQTEFM